MEANTQPNPTNGEQETVVSTPRSLVYVLITAAIFFLLGYGIAWFSFNAASSTQSAAIEETVRAAVAEAFADLDLQGVAADPEPTVPSIVEVDTDDDPALGPEDAPIVIVEFSDFRCSYCGRFYAQTLDPLLEQYGDQIRFVYRDFPVVGGERAALAAECADDQNVFWEYHNLLFNNQSALGSDESLVELASSMDIDLDTFATCLSDETHAAEIQADFEQGVNYGVRGTPAFFINGRPVIGAQPIGSFTQIIDEILAEQEAG
jgi:protein-disulfide isomerase